MTNHSPLQHYINAFAVTTGALTTVLSTASLAALLSAIAAPIGASLAAISALMGITSTATGVSSERLNNKLAKHEKTVFLAESKHISISRLVSKAMSDGLISDVEFNLILREIENYYSLKGKLRMEVKKIENISSDETLGQEIKKKIQQRLGSLIDISN